MEIDQIRRDIAGKASEVMELLTTLDDTRKTLNEFEKTVSRLRNELNEMYEKLDNALDKQS